MAGLLIAGTSSDAGKSALVTGLCRALSRRGIAVAPFKAQNMSNNSMVCADGAEIGRSQYLQALAAGVRPAAVHNPVLLKPASDRRSFIVLRGEPAGTLKAGEYATGRTKLAQVAFAAYDEVAASCELVICEGAGSPAEINLRGGDYVNMGLARAKDIPVVVVGDIDRGGVLASLYGTWALLEPADRSLIKAFAINKFRGDPEVLTPGLSEVTKRTSVPFLGVVPWLEGLWMDAEDALSSGQYGQTHSLAERAVGPDASEGGIDQVMTSPAILQVAVALLPRTSNATDVDALAAEPGVQVTVTKDPEVLRSAHVMVIPGSRATISDLEWMHERGITTVLRERAQAQQPIVGICGGYQILLEAIEDEAIESSLRGTISGLGLLPGVVRFQEEKILGRPRGYWQGIPVTGYEIHHGVVQDAEGEAFPGGNAQGSVFGTMWHGIFENDDFRREFLTVLANLAGSAWHPISAPGFVALREAMIDALADAVEEHLDVPKLLSLAGINPERYSLNSPASSNTSAANRRNSQAEIQPGHQQ